MEKEELRAVISQALLSVPFATTSETERIITVLTNAVWVRFILFPQGEKAELPAGVRSMDPTPERSCVECGAREGFGQIAFTGGAIICVQCLYPVKERSREAREFWERAFVAYLHAPKNFPSAKGGMLQGEEIADLALGHWMARFGKRND